jgi:hypothetical protein
MTRRIAEAAAFLGTVVVMYGLLRIVFLLFFSEVGT